MSDLSNNFYFIKKENTFNENGKIKIEHIIKYLTFSYFSLHYYIYYILRKSFCFFLYTTD